MGTGWDCGPHPSQAPLSLKTWPRCGQTGAIGPLCPAETHAAATPKGQALGSLGGRAMAAGAHSTAAHSLEGKPTPAHPWVSAPAILRGRKWEAVKAARREDRVKAHPTPPAPARRRLTHPHHRQSLGLRKQQSPRWPAPGTCGQGPNAMTLQFPHFDRHRAGVGTEPAPSPLPSLPAARTAPRAQTWAQSFQTLRKVGGGAGGPSWWHPSSHRPAGAPAASPAQPGTSHRASQQLSLGPRKAEKQQQSRRKGIGSQCTPAAPRN